MGYYSLYREMFICTGKKLYRVLYAYLPLLQLRVRLSQDDSRLSLKSGQDVRKTRGLGAVEKTVE